MEVEKMSTIKEILNSKKKPKQIVKLLVEVLKRDEKLIAELIQCFEDGTTAEKGNCSNECYIPVFKSVYYH